MKRLMLAAALLLGLVHQAEAAAYRFYYVTTDTWTESIAPPGDEYYFYDDYGPKIYAKFIIEVSTIYANTTYSSTKQIPYGSSTQDSYSIKTSEGDVFNSKPVKYGFSTDSNGSISSIFMSYGHYYDDLYIGKSGSYFWYSYGDIAYTKGYWVVQNLTSIPAGVPLPATAPMLLAGAGALAVIRRRRAN